MSVEETIHHRAFYTLHPKTKFRKLFLTVGVSYGVVHSRHQSKGATG